MSHRYENQAVINTVPEFIEAGIAGEKTVVVKYKVVRKKIYKVKDVLTCSRNPLPSGRGSSHSRSSSNVSDYFEVGDLVGVNDQGMAIKADQSADTIGRVVHVHEGHTAILIITNNREYMRLRVKTL